MNGASRNGFVVSIRAVDGSRVIGLGFVVGDQSIVTCAHVVNAALGRDQRAQGRPEDTVRIPVEFPLLGSDAGTPARVCRIAAWDPPSLPGGTGCDVAGLVIAGGDVLPPRAGPARTIGEAGAYGREVAVFGYPGSPDRKATGAWSVCRLRGSVSGGMIQLDGASESALRAQPGYSGGPVIVSDGPGDAVVGMLAIAPKDGSASDAYAIPLSTMSAVWPEVIVGDVISPCPYRGLQAFTAADADAGLFVGRESEISHLRTMIRRQQAMLVVGPSGVGKSSLVEAGLVPHLRDEGWIVSGFRPGVLPFDAMARCLLHVERPDVTHSLSDMTALSERLTRDGFWKVAEQLAVLTGRQLVIVCDQLEEALTDGAEQGTRNAFLEQLLPAAGRTPEDRGVRLVCTLRADFLPALLEIPGLGMRLQDRQLSLSPLDKSSLARVIVEPAVVAGVAYADRLAETIANDASLGRGGLPLLEFTLTELWATQHGQRLTFDDYHAIGKVAGALNRHAERAYLELADGFGENRIRRVLLAMTRTRGGSASAVRAVVRRENLGADWPVVEALANSAHRLVVMGPEGPGTAEIAHEALIREWGRLATWVDQDAEFQRWLMLMEERAAEQDLLSDARIGEAQRWLTMRGDDIPDDVAHLISQSKSAVALRIAELEAARRNAEELLARSQGLTVQLEARSAELQDQQNALRRTNTELEQQASLLAEQNFDIAAKNLEIEEARLVLEERAQQLALSSQYKDEFLANMSHELRTPLNSLLILARLLGDDSEGNLSPRQREYAETIHSAGSDLLSLINDILDLSKIASGHVEMRGRNVAIVEIIEWAEASFLPLAAMKGIDLVTRVEPDVPDVLHTDEQRLHQILSNLLANALKFTDSGSVQLLVERAQVNVLEFIVTDTGVGISDEDQSFIFDAFRQVDGSISRKHGGTGLGLTICRDLARLLHGRISVRSTLGSGSQFVLSHPLNAPEVTPAEEDAPIEEVTPTEQDVAPAVQFSGETVLVVDDDIRNLYVLETVLEERGLTILTAYNGREGLDVIDGPHKVDLVLMDIMMPEMDGYTAIREIRLRDKFRELPIIAVTARAMRGDREKAIQAGASAYVTKPFDAEKLVQLIHWWLNSSVHSAGVTET